jgi:hypothetical protein
MNHYCKLCRAELIPFALTDQKKNRVLTCPLCIDKYPPELFTIIIKNSDNTDQREYFQ